MQRSKHASPSAFTPPAAPAPGPAHHDLRTPWQVAAPALDAPSAPSGIGQMAASGAGLCCVLFAIYANSAIDDLALDAGALLWQAALAAAAGALAGCSLWLLLRLLQRPLLALMAGTVLLVFVQVVLGVDLLGLLLP